MTLCSELHKEGRSSSEVVATYALHRSCWGGIEITFKRLYRGDTSRKLATQLLSSLRWSIGPGSRVW